MPQAPIGAPLPPSRAFAAALRFLVLLPALLAAGAVPLAAGVNAWTPVGPDAGFVNALAVAAGPTSAIYAGTASAGVFKSLDRGATWSSANGQLGDLGVFDLRADPVDPRILYAATGTALYKTVDGGATWRPVLRGIVLKVAVAPSALRTVYAEVLEFRSLARIYRSRDGDAYTGRCPRCGKAVKFPIGEGGTDQRSFIVE